MQRPHLCSFFVLFKVYHKKQPLKFLFKGEKGNFKIIAMSHIKL